MKSKENLKIILFPLKLKRNKTSLFDKQKKKIKEKLNLLLVLNLV